MNKTKVKSKKSMNKQLEFNFDTNVFISKRKEAKIIDINRKKKLKELELIKYILENERSF